jgi:hypothetical protein
MNPGTAMKIQQTATRLASGIQRRLSKQQRAVEQRRTLAKLHRAGDVRGDDA